jgi:hypothetical protein
MNAHDKKVKELDKKYGDLAHEVVKEVLNNIPLTYQAQRETWARLNVHYMNKQDEK